MQKPDILSRRADYNKGEGDNDGVIFIKEEWLVRGVVQTSRDNLVKLVEEAQEKLTEADVPKQKGVTKESGFWSKKGILFVPESARSRVLEEFHDSPLAGHPGGTKTVASIRRNYWWPTLYSDARAYVRGCDRCQRTKALRTTRAKVLHPNEVPEAPWQVVTVDFIGELPESNGFNAICVLVDRFSKQMHAIPTTTKITAEGTAKIYRDHVFRLHGLPRKIIHDRGTQFDAKMMKELYKLLHIEGNPSTAFHPQTDGQTERVNQEIEQYLRLYVNHRQSDWADWLAIAEFAYNNREHSATKMSPFYVNTGRHPMDPSPTSTSSSNLSAEEFAKHLKEIHSLAQANLVKAADDMKRYHDRHAGEEIIYEAGAKVFLDGRHIKTNRPSAKMEDKWFGPFEVMEKVGASAYRLKLPRTWRQVHPVFNVSLPTLALTP